MTERGTVTALEGKTLKVKLGGMNACAACMNSECKEDGGTIEAMNPEGFDLNEGDSVEVSIPASKAAGDALIVFLIPLALFVAAYLGSGAIFPGGGEGISILSGFIGLLLGGGTAVMIKRGIKINDLPRVMRKYETSSGFADSAGADEEGT